MNELINGITHENFDINVKSQSEHLNELQCEPVFVYDFDGVVPLLRCYEGDQPLFFAPHNAKGFSANEFSFFSWPMELDGQTARCSEVPFYGIPSIQCSNEKGTFVVVARSAPSIFPVIYGTALLAQVGAHVVRSGIGFLLSRFGHREAVVEKKYLSAETALDALEILNKKLDEVHFNYLFNIEIRQKQKILPSIVRERYQLRCRYANRELADLKTSLQNKNPNYLTEERLANYQHTADWLCAEHTEFERANAKLAKIESYEDLFKNSTGLLLQKFMDLNTSKPNLEKVVNNYGYRMVAFDDVDPEDEDAFFYSITHQLLLSELKGDFSKISPEELKQKFANYRIHMHGKMAAYLKLCPQLYDDLFDDHSLLVDLTLIQKWRHYIRTIVLSRALNLNFIIVPSDDSTPIVIKQASNVQVIILGYDVEKKYFSLLLDEKNQHPQKNIHELFHHADQDNYKEELIDPLVKKQAMKYGYQCVLVSWGENSFLYAVIDQLAKIRKIEMKLEFLKNLVTKHLNEYVDDYKDVKNPEVLACARLLNISIAVISSADEAPLIVRHKKPQAIIAIGRDGSDQYYSLLRDNVLNPHPEKDITSIYLAASEDAFEFHELPPASKNLNSK
ncbi:MAG: hypothetical protein JSS53_05390 [Proteobacteria bacterium]|nr:hypothetical protein [Pseudomonadota bacterium]